jgi:hypothetical protein
MGYSCADTGSSITNFASKPASPSKSFRSLEGANDEAEISEFELLSKEVQRGRVSIRRHMQRVDLLLNQSYGVCFGDSEGGRMLKAMALGFTESVSATDALRFQESIAPLLHENSDTQLSYCALMCLQSALLLHTLRSSYTIEDKMYQLRSEQIRKFEEIYSPLPQPHIPDNEGNSSTSVAHATDVTKSEDQARHEAIVKSFRDSEVSYALVDIQRFHFRSLYRTLEVCTGFYGSSGMLTRTIPSRDHVGESKAVFWGTIGADLLKLLRSVVVPETDLSTAGRTMKAAEWDKAPHMSPATKLASMLSSAELINEYEQTTDVRSAFAYDGERLSEFIKGSGHRFHRVHKRLTAGQLATGQPAAGFVSSVAGAPIDFRKHKHSDEDDELIHDVTERLAKILADRGSNIVPQSINLVFYIISAQREYEPLCKHC